MNKYIVSKNDVNSLSNEELMKVIGRSVPKETQEYVPHVQSRMALYREL